MGAEYTEGDKMAAEDPIQVAPASPPPYVVDCEKHGAKPDSNPLPDLKRTLKSRHLQMIAMGALAAS